MTGRKVNTFSKRLDEQAVEQEKALGTPVGKALQKADEEYEKRKKEGC